MGNLYLESVNRLYNLENATYLYFDFRSINIDNFEVFFNGCYFTNIHFEDNSL